MAARYSSKTWLDVPNLFVEDKIEQNLVVAVVKGQVTAHHLVHHHAQSPPVDAASIVVVLRQLQVSHSYMPT